MFVTICFHICKWHYVKYIVALAKADMQVGWLWKEAHHGVP